MSDTGIGTKENRWFKELMYKYYRSNKNWLDGTKEFHNLCKRHIHNGHTVLELGAGPGGLTSGFINRICRELHGVDIDNQISDNPYLSKAVIYDGNRLPFDDNSYEIVCSDFVNEHLQKPQKIAAEIYRVLKPGGKYIFRTPNLYHYVSLFAKFTPLFMHKAIANRLRSKKRGDTSNIHKTYYRFNSRKACCEILENAGLKILEFFLIEKDPSYGRNLIALFYIFMFYERLVNSSKIFENIRANILCVAEKTTTG